MDNYVTIGEAAKLIGVSPETLRRWDKSGKIKSIRHPINNYTLMITEKYAFGNLSLVPW